MNGNMFKHKSPPKLRFKIPLSKGEIECPIYSNSNNIISSFITRRRSRLLRRPRRHPLLLLFGGELQASTGSNKFVFIGVCFY